MLVTLLVAGLLLFSGASRKMRDWSEKFGRWRFLHTAIYALMFILAVYLLALPWTVYLEYWREHQYGLLTQDFGEWFVENLIMLGVSLVIGVPVIALFAAIVYRESPGPVLYRQTRSGRGGQPFEIIKIRSMRIDAEAASGAQWCAEDDPRRLKIGALMRRLNIDELPQFWNVLKGEMSLVGPRPERPELIQGFKSEIAYYNIRHTVKPGITGWAQVNGWRGDTCLQSRIACDLEYIESASLWFDIRILLMTVRATNNAY